MNENLKNTMDRRLSSLAWDDRRSQTVLRKIKGEPIMKKRMTAILATALMFTLLAAAAIAAISFTRSPKVDIESQARQALYQKYGLSPVTLGVFYPMINQQGEDWTVTYYADGMPAALVGDYMVTIKKGAEPVAAWTHDGAEQALLDSGSLNSPVWGPKQIKTALIDKDEKEAAIGQHIKDRPEAFQATPVWTPMPRPENLQDDEAYFYGKIWKDAQPGAKSLSREQALDIAKTVLVEEFDLNEQDMKYAEITDTLYREAQDGSAIWSIHLYLTKDGMEWGLGVMIDAKTGEVQSVGITTGGNG